ncbi:hypothetical protein, partial [Paenibacillus alvei]|uniref:hypothetical protein n=1 Tax=Paenibacillus alvei TaxID=44250 RepID=UPI0019D605D2
IIANKNKMLAIPIIFFFIVSSFIKYAGRGSGCCIRIHNLFIVRLYTHSLESLITHLVFANGSEK